MMTDLKTIKVGDHVTVRRERAGKITIEGFDIVKFTGVRWARMSSGSRYSYDGSEFRTFDDPVGAIRKWASPTQNGDQEEFEKQQCEKDAKRRKEDSTLTHRRELEKRFHNAIEAEPDPSPVFKAMAHFLSTGGVHDYELLKDIEEER